MADKQILVEINYDTDAAEKQIDDLTKAIVKNENAQKELREELKKGNITQEEYSKSTAKLREQKKKSNQLRTQTIKLVQSEDNSLEKLEAQMSRLRKERGKLNLKTKEGIERRKQINKELNTFTKLQKEQLDKDGKRIKNIGNYTGALGKMNAGLLKAGAVLTGVVVGVKAFMGAINGYLELQKKVRDITNSVARSTGLMGQELKDATRDVRVIADVFDEDYNDVVKSATVFSKEMGVSFDASLKLIKEGFEKGADVNGEFLNQLKEYPAQLKQVGLSAKESIAIITQTEREGGVFSDKGIDAIKEAGIRLRELTPVTKEALANIGLSSKQIEKDLRTGSKSMFDVIQQVSNKLGDFPEQSTEVGQSLADIFGGAGEDAGIRYIKMLGDINTNLDEVVDSSTDAEKATRKWDEEWSKLTTSMAEGEGLFGQISTGIKKMSADFVESLNGINMALTDSEKASTLFWEKFSPDLVNDMATKLKEGIIPYEEFSKKMKEMSEKRGIEETKSFVAAVKQRIEEQKELESQANEEKKMEFDEQSAAERKKALEAAKNKAEELRRQEEKDAETLARLKEQIALGSIEDQQAKEELKLMQKYENEKKAHKDNNDILLALQEMYEQDKAAITKKYADEAEEERLKEQERRGMAIAKLAELKQKELELEAQSAEELRNLQIESEIADFESFKEQDDITKEEIELREFEHKTRMLDIEAEYQNEVSAQRQQALDDAFDGMQEIIAATNGMADQRVSIMSDAFSRISTINLKEIESNAGKVVAIGQAAQGLTSLITAGNDKELADFEARKSKELELAGDNAEHRAAVEAKYAKKEKEIKKRQFREDKIKAMADVVMATALAVTKAIAASPLTGGLPFSAFVGALGAVQLATVAAQKPSFKEGGTIVDGPSHAGGGVNVYGDNGQLFGNVEGNEAMFVMKKNATAELAALSMLNEKHGGRSFSGDNNSGVFEEGGQMNPTDIGNQIAEAMKNITIVTKLSDIATGLTELNDVKQAGVV